LVPAAGVLLWGGVVACETDDWSSNRRMETAASPAPDNPPDALPSVAVSERAESDLQQEMTLHRTMYARYLQVLAEYYSQHGIENNANSVRTELNDLEKVKTYKYITETEVPAAPLRPLESIAEADRLYEQAYRTLVKGGHHVLFFYNHATMNQALTRFK